jgi:hypothetical protein
VPKRYVSRNLRCSDSGHNRVTSITKTATIARIAGQASSLLHLTDVNEKISVENAATIAVAKRHSLPISE